MTRPPRTRFAPSPTGDLHLGGAWTALASWVLAHRAGGQCVLRIEDIDSRRVVPGSQSRIEADLRWLGLVFDEGPYLQSARVPVYEDAIETLSAKGLVYPCDCSRSEVAQIASAPHRGREPVYPGVCRDRSPARVMKRPPALRVRVPDEVVAYDDFIAGHVAQNLAHDVGDFVIRRGDGLLAYQLAVVVDDLAMGMTHVVRGADLVASTPRQIWLARALGSEPPAYGHVPLVVASDGARLEKRRSVATVSDLRSAGVSASRIVGELAYGLGIVPDAAPTSAPDVARRCADALPAWRQEPWHVPPSLVR